MLALAIDTALDACAAAILDSAAGRILAQESQSMPRGHAEALMPMIARVADAAGIKLAALDRVIATTGPGSFTGLRVGLSAARGIALAAGKPVVGVTTLTAFAAPHVAREEDHPVISAIDARHGHVYFQAVTGNGKVLIPPRVAPLEEALRAARFGPACLVGNAARLLADQWPNDLSGPPVLVDQTAAPEISWVAWLGAAIENPAKSPAKPLYLRPPDAHPQRAAHIARQDGGQIPAPDGGPVPARPNPA